MPLNFPDNPQQNDTFTVNGRTYTYNGSRWRRTKARLADVSPTLDVANDFTAGGALHVDSDTGRVGIGTANPQYELHVDGTGEVTGDFQVGQNLDVTGTVDINGLRLTSDGSSISLSEVLAGTYSTQAATTNDDTLATTAFVQSAIANLVDSAPGTLNTLNELAAALDDDPNFATTVTNSISLKLDSSSYTAADVLAKIKTVDGASSGLDADTLDGSHASAFATSSHTHSYLPLSGGTVTGHVTLSGVSIKLPNSSSEGIHTSDDYRVIDSVDGTLRIGDTNKHTIVRLHGQGSDDFRVYYGGNDYTIWHTGNDGSGSGLDADTLDGSHASAFLGVSAKAADSNLFDGQDSVEFTRYAGSLTTEDWNTLVNGTESSYYNVVNGSGSNRPSAYMYGALVSWSTASGSKFQLYSPHNGVSGNGLWWRSGWNTDYDSWVEVWTSGTDGSGSGLDADLLDGNHASAFATSSHSHSYLPTSGGTLTGNLAMSNKDITGVNWLTINDAGEGIAFPNVTLYQNATTSTILNLTGDLHVSGIIQPNEMRASDVGGSTDCPFTYVGDEDTGMYLYGTDSTALASAGTWRLRTTTSGVLYNGSHASSTMRLKENIRTASEVEGYATADREDALNKMLALRPVVYDPIEKSKDAIWQSCSDGHESEQECIDAKCIKVIKTSEEHRCGRGFCNGTVDNPCPAYTQNRNRLHFIAEEVREVYGDHLIGLSPEFEVESIDTQAFYTEHMNVTQHLIRYVRELESRIAVLEAN